MSFRFNLKRKRSKVTAGSITTSDFHVRLITGPARVIDGDTLDVSGVRVRLEGIDAAESGQTCRSQDGSAWRCGRSATRALRRLIAGRPVTCERLKTGRYGRAIALCRAGNTDLNAQMVRDGQARAFVKYSRRYVAEEARARRGRRGIWRAAAAITPWDYRKRRWAGATQSAPEGCPIKGNVTRNGRIYHMPWSPWYPRTRIDPARGERWFCSETEAKAAGWRPAGHG